MSAFRIDPAKLRGAGLMCGAEVVLSHLEVADNPLSRMRGLLGRDGLDEDGGLLIVPCNSIHMFFMRFAIDAVFLSRELRVLKIYENLKPWRLAGCFAAYSVLELRAGRVARTGLTVGAELRAAGCVENNNLR